MTEAFTQTSAPVAPPTVARDPDETVLLVAFLRDRDVQCPRCDYNLRNATSAACSECGEPLRLAVGLERSIMGALLTTIAPGLGCGVCSLIFFCLMVLHPGAPAGVVLTTVIMFFSGVLAAIILVRRRAFLRLSRERQRLWASVSCSLHVILIVMLFIAMANS